MKPLPLVLCALLLVGCGGGDDSPSRPTPVTAQVGGVWGLSETFTSITGGECFATALQSAVGTTGTGTIQITQAGAALTARATDDSTGGSCDYTGTAGTNTIALNTNSCTASDVIGATCPNSTARRDLRLQTGGYNLTVTGVTASGSGAQTYNVFVAGTSNTVGTVIFNTRLTATKR